MRILRLALASTVLVGGTFATVARAEPGYCSNFSAPLPSGVPAPPPPLSPEPPQTKTFAYIVTGYRGAGSAGALDGYGCVGGQQVADTRLVYPHADFALMIVSTKCTPGAKAVGSLNGLGLVAPKVPLVCAAPDSHGVTHYASNPYAINPAASGKIITAIVLAKKLYTAESHTAT